MQTEVRYEKLFELRTIGQAPQGVVKATVTVDAAKRTFKLVPAADAYRLLGQQVPAMTGFLDEESQEIGGIVSGSRGDTSPNFVLARADEADKKILRTLRESAEPARGGLSIFGGGSNDKAVQWAARLTQEYPSFDTYHTAMGGVWVIARNLFRDEYFKPFFGSSYIDMSAGELNRIHNQLIRVPAPRGNFPEEKPLGTLRVLQAAFLPQPAGFKIPDFRLSALGMQAMAGWRAQTIKRLAALPAANDSWAAFNAAEAAEGESFSAFFPSERQVFAAALAQDRGNMAPPLLAQQVEALIAASQGYANVPALGEAYATISRAASSGNGPSLGNLSALSPAGVRQAQLSRIGARHSSLIGAEVAGELESASGYAGLKQMLSTQQAVSQQYALTQSESTEEHRAVLARVQSKIEALLTSQVATERDGFVAFASRASGLEALAESKEREQKLLADYAGLTGKPQFAAFNEERQSYRHKLIGQSSQSLINLVNNAEHVGAIDAVVGKYIVTPDLDSAEAAQFKSAIAGRVAVISPFRELPGGEYLDAIYGGDRAELQKLDDEYLASFENLLGPLRNYFRNNVSVEVSVLTNYLLEYQDSYARCLRPDHATFTLTTEHYTDTVGQFGQLIARSYGYSTHQQFMVNREFAAAFRNLGTREPDSFAAFDAFLGKGKVAQVLSGTRGMMRKFDCNDPRIKRMERNMLALYDN